MTQTDIILKHLQENKNGITQLEATNLFGFTRLSAIIYELKKQGYKFKTTREKGVNRYGRKVCFVRYSIVSSED